jgi:predicted acetyltransferase
MRDAAIVTAGLMGRVVHVAAACALRPTTATGALTLRLADPVIEANNRTFQLQLADGRIAAAHTDAPADASCDIVTFSQLFCGVLKASAARRYARLEADDTAVALLDQAFAGPPPFVHPADMF